MGTPDVKQHDADPIHWLNPAVVFRTSPLLTVCAVAGWLLGGLFILKAQLGGYALGTLPAEQGFVVLLGTEVSHVTETTWVLAAVYELIVSLFTPASWIALVVAQRSRMPVAHRTVLLMFLPIWAAWWYVAVLNEAWGSVTSYLSM